jgi:uncharacterized membrane protein
MIARLRQPGGTLGGLSVAAAITLTVLGILGVVTLLVAVATGSDFWADETSAQLYSIVFFVLMVSGALGFLIMDQQPGIGAALAVVGSLAFALILWWALVPLLAGLVFAVAAVVRARALRKGSTGAAPGTAHRAG